MSSGSASLAGDGAAHDVSVLPRPTPGQAELLSRHAGASRFAFNECLRGVKAALDQCRRQGDRAVAVPWSGLDLINYFNAWKKTAVAGRVIAVGAGGEAEVVSTGLTWRGEVCQQVFEEAAVDLGRALKAWRESRADNRGGKRVGFPRFKRKNRAVPSFRLRNKTPKTGRDAIRVGQDGICRAVRLAGIGTVRVRDDTRRLRRLIANGRGVVLFATCTWRAGRWWVSLSNELVKTHARLALEDLHVAGILANRQAAGPEINARRQAGAGPHPSAG